MLEKKLKCKECGHEVLMDTKNILTGVHFDMGFVITCGECRGNMYEIPYEPGKHTTECEKVMARYDN
jgi:hypothetical protein